MVASAVNADLAEHCVIFVGSGMTGAVSKMAHLFGMYSLRGKPASARASQRIAVFVGPYEHHSNEVFWREMNCDLVVRPAHLPK